MSLPRTAPEFRSPRRLGPRVALGAAVAVIVVLFVSFRALSVFYTDKLWFESISFGDTFSGIIWAHILPALMFSAAMFVVLLVNLVIADRLAPKFRTAGIEDEVIDRYRSYVLPYAGRFRVFVALLFSVMVGFGASSQWQEWILFKNRVPWGVKDAQFHNDIGFYVFELPFYKFVVDWLFVVLFVVLAVTAIFHYFNGGIRLQAGFQRVTPQVKAHLSVVLALMAFVKMAQYWLGRYDLVFSHRGAVDGATYTDVHAQLPALQFLSLISVVGGLLFVVNIWQRGWKLPIIAAGLWAFISVAIGTAYPAYVQRFTVQPSERSSEQQYIARNIEATRIAYGIDAAHVEHRSFATNGKLDATSSTDPNVRATLDNIRLWDPIALGDSSGGKIQADEGFKSYYQFGRPSVDRYTVGAQKQLVMSSMRGLNQSGIPSSTWVNQHLAYTHGTGGVIVEGSRTSVKDPSYLLRGIPPTGEADVSMAKQPDIYFGTNLSGYAVVGAKDNEIEAGSGGSDQSVRYAGNGGVVTSSWLRKAAFAARFGDFNFLISDRLTSKSRVMYIRDVRERVQKAAPFLRFDQEAYPVVLPAAGKTVWVIDGYTTTSQYPYSQQLRPGDIDSPTGIGSGFNYARNSVKAVVDAYDGTVTLYAVDTKDPLLEAYQKAFPKMFTSPTLLPEGLAEHFRYPTDLFKVQTRLYERYHEAQPDAFFNRSNQWAVTPLPAEETAAGSGGATAVTVATKGNDGGRNTSIESLGARVPAEYLMMQLPGDSAAQFVLTRSFVPVSSGAVTDNQLSAFIAARSDGYRADGKSDFGKLVVYDIPANRAVASPLKAAQTIQNDKDISKERSLLNSNGSKLLFGEIQLLPMNDSILYAQPVFISSSTSKSFNTFHGLALAYNDRAVLIASDKVTPGSTIVNDAFAQLFGTTSTPPGGTITPPPASNDSEKLANARREFQAYLKETKAGNFVEAAKHLDEMNKLLGAEPVPGTTTSTSRPGATPTTSGTGGTTTTTQPPATTSPPTSTPPATSTTVK